MIYLIEYDWKAGQAARITAYADDDRVAAQDARLALELALHSSGLEREVVLLEAVDEQALRLTHSRYFESLESMLAHATPP